MIENILIYMILASIAFVVYDIKKQKEDAFIERESDATIEVVAGRYMLKEK